MKDLLIKSVVIGILIYGAACSHRPLIDSPTSSSVAPFVLRDSAMYQFASEDQALLISQGDLISLTYLQDSRLNGRFRVSFEGYLQLPYEIREYVVGLDFTQLAQLIRVRYANLYKNVDEIGIVLVERKRWVQVTGDISPAGYRLIALNADITQILAQKEIGSTASSEERKKLKYLKIQFNNTSRIFDLKKYFNNQLPWDGRKWHGGEILSFQSNGIPDDSEFLMVRVMGEVAEPGSFELEPEKDFYSYILKAGGLRSSANLEHISLIRGGQFQRKLYEVEFNSIGDLGHPQANDTLVLFQDRSSKDERRLQMAVSIASLLSALTVFGILF